MNTLENLCAQANQKIGAHKQAVRTLEGYNAEIKEYETNLEIDKQAVLLLKQCLDECLKMRSTIETVVTEGFDEIFGDENTFVFEPVENDDQVVTGYQPKISVGNGELCDPKEDNAASVIAAGSILLQSVVVALCKRTAPVIISDENLAQLDQENWDRVGNVLQVLAESLGMQYIMLTHSPTPFGRVYQTSKIVDDKTGKEKSVITLMED